MSINFVPRPGAVLICDFDLARVHPEMRKVRRVVVISPRSANRRHGPGPGFCGVVPYSASHPRRLTPAEVPFAAGLYESLTVPTWALCGMVHTVSHERLDRVASGRTFLTETLTSTDMDRIRAGLRHHYGL